MHNCNVIDYDVYCFLFSLLAQIDASTVHLLSHAVKMKINTIYRHVFLTRTLFIYVGVFLVVLVL